MYSDKDKSLIDSIDNLRLIVDQSSDLIIVIRDKLIVFSNNSVEKLFGYGKSEIVGKPFLEFISDETKEESLQRYNRRMAGEDLPPLSETEVICKDGSIRPVEISTRPFEFEGKTAFIIIVRDISDRKEAEKALKESESRYKTLTENITDATVVNIDGKCVWVNRAFSDIFGYSFDEALGKTIEDLAHQDELQGICERMERRNRGETLSPFYETILIRKDGSPVNIEASIKPIIFDGREARQIIMRDITERKRAEFESARSEEKYRLLFENSDEPIVLVSEDGTFQMMNKRAADYFLKRPEDLIGKRMSDLFPPEIADRQMRSIAAVLESGRSAVFENRTILNNVERTFRTSITPVEKLFGSLQTVQLIARDVTEARARQLRDKTRLELHGSLRTARSVDQCLNLGCKAIYDAELFRRAVFTLHDKARRIVNIGYVGVERKVVEEAKRAAPLSARLVKKITQHKFRISKSYFIPAESELELESSPRYIPQDSQSLNLTGAWVNGDELFVPIFRSNREIAGWLSADTPFDKMRPDVEIIQYLELIADIIYFKIKDVENVKRIVAEGAALKDKNIALREVLGHIEEEKLALRKAVAGQIEQDILPAIDKAVSGKGTLRKSYIDMARAHLRRLASMSTGPGHAYSKLSRRESEVCRLIGAGHTNKEIAEMLSVSIFTVQKHRESIRRKFGLKNRSMNLAVYLQKLNYR